MNSRHWFMRGAGGIELVNHRWTVLSPEQPDDYIMCCHVNKLIICIHEEALVVDGRSGSGGRPSIFVLYNVGWKPSGTS
jgi:hypothetical protein